MASASVRFYGSLNDFLPAARRQSTLVCAFKESPSVKDLVESLGVPHPEIDLLIVDGQSVDFTYRVRDGNRVAVYPRIRAFDFAIWLASCHPRKPRRASLPTSISAGSPLTSGSRGSTRRTGTIIPTRRSSPSRPRRTASCSRATWACSNTARQARLLPARDAAGSAAGRGVAPLRSRHRRCALHPMPAMRQPVARRCEGARAALLPARTREHYREFSRCPTCRRIYWRGSHYCTDEALHRNGFRGSGARQPALVPLPPGIRVHAALDVWHNLRRRWFRTIQSVSVETRARTDVTRSLAPAILIRVERRETRALATSRCDLSGGARARARRSCGLPR